jgi:hypothetical protein
MSTFSSLHRYSAFKHNISSTVTIKKQAGWDGMDCIDLAQDKDHWRALVNTVMVLRVSYFFFFWKFLSKCATGGFSRMKQLYGIG